MKLKEKFIKSAFKNEKNVFLFCLIFSFLAQLLHINIVKIDFSKSVVVDYKKSVPVYQKIKLILPNKKSEKRQIVQTEQINNNDKNDSRFLSNKNNNFDKQTVSRNTGSFRKYKKNNRVHKVLTKLLKKISLSNLGYQQFKKIPNQRMVMRKIAQKQIGSSNDYIEDIPLGDMTRLNTSEYKYYGFYHRIKLKLEQHWGKSVHQKMTELYRRRGRAPASVVKVTSLVVNLDKMGKILNIHLKGSSGISELDQAAIESFNKAGPFPNPPAGMLKNGFAQIEWGFVLKG